MDRRRTAALALAMLALSAQRARAQDTPTTAIPQADLPPEIAPKPDEKKKKKRDLLLVPIPISTPATGSGLAVGAIMFHNPNHEPQQWVTGAGVVYTDHGTKGVAAFHSMSIGQDRMRFKLIASYIDGRTHYYGIGPDAGDAGVATEFHNKSLAVQLQAQTRLFRNGHLGVRFKYSSYDSRPPDDLAPGSPLPPEDQLKSSLSMIGPTLSYDTRDSATLPRSGEFLSATWLAGIKFLGNSYPHSKIQLSGNKYLSLRPETTLAVRASICGVTGSAPYYDMCSFGAGADLRGYEAGQYRDRVNWAAQAELRQKLTNRLGGVAFAGVGGVAPSLSGIVGDGNLLPSMGAGIRYRPFKGNDVNLRVDVAVGLQGGALYVGISEAF